MGVTLIEKLFAAGASLTGKGIRVIGGLRNTDGTVQAPRLDRNNNLIVNMDRLSGVKDVFGRLRTAEPFGVGDFIQVNDDGQYIFVQDLTGGATATYVPDESSTRLSVTTSAGDKAIRQTRKYIPYEPGRSQFFLFTGRFNAAEAGVRKRIGVFDANDGYFLEQDVDGTMYVVRRTSTSGAPVESRVAQSSWNVDQFDGSGPSGRTFVPSSLSVMFLEIGWLGGAGARIGFVDDGKLISAHTFDLFAGSAPHIKTPFLPIRWEIENVNGSASAANLLQTCAAAFSEGGFDPQGYVSAAARESFKSVGTTWTPILAIRLKPPTYARGTLEPIKFSGFNDSNVTAQFRLLLRCHMTGASWQDTTTGATQYDVASTASTGGIVLDVITVGPAKDGGGNVSSSLSSALLALADFAGDPDHIGLQARAVGGTASVLGEIQFREVR